MKFLKSIIHVAAIGTAAQLAAAPAAAQSEMYLGQVFMFTGSFCPAGSVETSGQALPITQNASLFSVMGVQFGGDGQTSFNVPDLRGRMPMHAGAGPDLSGRSVGETGGAENFQLITDNIPAHSHPAQLLSNATVAADSGNPSGNALGRSTDADIYTNVEAPVAANALHSGSVVIGNTGEGEPVTAISPYTVLRFCVVTQGPYPPRP
ncbi:phage tail protein [Altererythrobacter luteolus]|uniref:Phage tail protein n=1 Tax=Pontixanthobacter luteolus TaxID=295089 RepID=A0A6I4V2Z3_9SPHN|nr:tail fiber protein [Pontixanthobacter luteolus]MXP46332.1 phage tail protein [Pontixanthobacter luteolus]